MEEKKILRNGTTMTITELEYTLGFRWKAGLGHIRATHTDTPPCILRLQRDLLKLSEDFDDMTSAQMKESHAPRARLRACFDDIGPMLWPDGQGRGAWLVDAISETWNGLYKRDLFFSDADDRETCVHATVRASTLTDEP